MTDTKQEQSALRRQLRSLNYALRILEYDRRRLREVAVMFAKEKTGGPFAAPPARYPTDN